jgi:hypothetical protein
MGSRATAWCCRIHGDVSLFVSYLLNWCSARLLGTSYAWFSHAESPQRTHSFFSRAEEPPKGGQGLALQDVFQLSLSRFGCAATRFRFMGKCLEDVYVKLRRETGATQGGNSCSDRHRVFVINNPPVRPCHLAVPHRGAPRRHGSEAAGAHHRARGAPRVVCEAGAYSRLLLNAMLKNILLLLCMNCLLLLHSSVPVPNGHICSSLQCPRLGHVCTRDLFFIY